MVAQTRYRSAEFIARLEKLDSQPLVTIASEHGVGTRAELKRLFRYRELLDLLVRRDLKMRYKDSALGFAWTLIRPLAMLAVYWIALGKFLGAARNIPDFAIYLFCGLALWQLFIEIVNGASGSVIVNAGLVKKVDLPMLAFPLSTVGSALFNFAIQLVVLLGACLAFGAFPTGARWAFFPAAVAVALVWGTWLGILLSAVNVYLRDVQYLVEIGLTVWFWACPVIYSWELVLGATQGIPWLRDIFLLNPMANAVLAMQQTFWVAGTDKPIPENLVLHLWGFALVGVVMLWVSQRVFHRLAGNFAQEL